MYGDLSNLDTLLGGITREQSAIGSLKLACLEQQRKRSSAELYSCDALWSTRTDISATKRHNPRHQTLRRRGEAPAFPRPIELTRGTQGRLVLLRDGLSLEPTDNRLPCTHISVASIRSAIFFSDCVKIIHDKSERTLISCEAIDRLDLMFEAHFQDL